MRAWRRRKQADSCNDEEARLDEEFAAIGPSERGIFQGGISEEAVPKEGGEINEEVERLPKMAA